MNQTKSAFVSLLICWEVGAIGLYSFSPNQQEALEENPAAYLACCCVSAPSLLACAFAHDFCLRVVRAALLMSELLTAWKCGSIGGGCVGCPRGRRMQVRSIAPSFLPRSPPPDRHQDQLCLWNCGSGAGNPRHQGKYLSHNHCSVLMCWRQSRAEG